MGLQDKDGNALIKKMEIGLQSSRPSGPPAVAAVVSSSSSSSSSAGAPADEREREQTLSPASFFPAFTHTLTHTHTQKQQQIKTNAPGRVSVDVASGVIAPGCSKPVRVYWASSSGSSSLNSSSSDGAVVAIAARPLPADTPLARAAAAALLGREIGGDDLQQAAFPDVIVPIVIVPRLSSIEKAEATLAAAPRLRRFP